MKKLIQLTVIFLLAGIVFSSCSSNLSITKRRYTKGYFVQHHKNARAAERTAATEASRPAAQKFAPSVLVEKAGPALNEQYQKSAVVTAEAARKPDVKARKTSQQETAPVEMAIKNPIKAVNTAAKLVKSAATSDDALSLLWVVIVVILILYLLGLLFDGFGLGNLIHLLAVIAVVLLILWLLRII